MCTDIYTLYAQSVTLKLFFFLSILQFGQRGKLTALKRVIFSCSCFCLPHYHSLYHSTSVSFLYYIAARPPHSLLSPPPSSDINEKITNSITSLNRNNHNSSNPSKPLTRTASEAPKYRSTATATTIMAKAERPHWPSTLRIKEGSGVLLPRQDTNAHDQRNKANGRQRP